MSMHTWRQFQEKWNDRLKNESGEERDAIHMALLSTEANGTAEHRRDVFVKQIEGVEGTHAANARREAQNNLGF